MSDDERGVARALVEDGLEPAAVARSGEAGRAAPVLDLAAEVLQYRYSKGELGRDEYLKRYLAVLRARSAIALAGNDPVPGVEPAPPEAGHRTSRISIAAGWRSLNGRIGFADLGWRPAYHDRRDPAEGFAEGSQINFFTTVLRYTPEEKSLKLRELQVLDILSLTPREPFIAPVSWKFRTGLDRVIARSGGEELVYRINPGYGVSYGDGRTVLFHLLAEADLEVSNRYEDRSAFAIGPSAGLELRPAARWKLSLSGGALHYFLGEHHRVLQGSVWQTWQFSRNGTIGQSVKQVRSFGRESREVAMAWNWYY